MRLRAGSGRSGLAGAEDRMVVGFKHGPALKIPVALPDPAQAVGIVAALVTRQDPHLQRVGHRGHDRRQDGGTLRDLLLRARAAPKRDRHGAGQQQQSDDGRVSHPKSRPAHRRRDGHFERDRNRRGRHRRYGLRNRRRRALPGSLRLEPPAFPRSGSAAERRAGRNRGAYWPGGMSMRMAWSAPSAS